MSFMSADTTEVSRVQRHQETVWQKDAFAVVFDRLSKAKDPWKIFSSSVCNEKEVDRWYDERGLETAVLKGSQQKKGTIG